MKSSTKVIIGVVVVALVGASVYFGNTKLQKGSLTSASAIKPNFAWVTPASQALLTGSQVEVARFNLGADASSDPTAYVTIPQLNLYSSSTATLTNFTLVDVTQGSNVASNSNSSNFYNWQNGGNMKPLTFQQGESRQFKILADVGTNAGNQTAQFKYKDSLSFALTAASVGTDTTPPSILSIALSNGGGANELNAGDTITIYFSEKINSYPLNTVYGVSTSPKSNSPGSVNVDNNGDIIVNGVVKLVGLGLSKVPTIVNTSNSLNSGGNILTITIKETNGTKSITPPVVRKGSLKIKGTIYDTAGNKMIDAAGPTPTGSL